MAPVPDPNNVGGGAKRDEATTKVPSKDPKKKDDKKEDDLVSSISHSLLKILLGF